jgi:hypothetical protein
MAQKGREDILKAYHELEDGLGQEVNYYKEDGTFLLTSTAVLVKITSGFTYDRDESIGADFIIYDVLILTENMQGNIPTIGSFFTDENSNRYNVMPMSGRNVVRRSPWSYSDEFNLRLRIHTKFIGTPL